MTRWGRGFGALALAGLVAGCSMINNAVSNLSLPQPAKMKYAGPYPASRQEVWKIAREAAARDWRFEKVDHERGRLTSEWDVLMVPSLYASTRRQLTLEVEEKKDGVRVGVKVLRQQNENMEEPLSEGKAEWNSKGSDLDAEQELLWRINSRLTRFEPSPEFLRKLEWEEANRGK